MPLGRVFLLLAFVGNRSKNSPVESGAFVWTVVQKVQTGDSTAKTRRLFERDCRRPFDYQTHGGKDAPFRALRNSMHPQNYDRCVIGLVPQRKFIHGSKDHLNQRVGALCGVFGNRS